MKTIEKEFKEILVVPRTDKQRIEMLESLVLKLARQIDALTYKGRHYNNILDKT